MVPLFQRIRCLLVLCLIMSMEAAAQDVTVLLTTKFQGSALPLDSVLLENATNNTRAMLTKLPTSITTYRINLSKGKIINGVETLNELPSGFSLYSNRPGDLRIYAKTSSPETVTISLYDLPGRLVFTGSVKCPSGVSLLTFHPGRFGSGIVMASCPGYRKVFKVTGDDQDRQNPALSVESGLPSATSVKETFSTADFVFTPGDSVRFSVFHRDIYPASKQCQPQQDDSIVIGVTRPCQGTPVVADYDGNIYHTVQIGEQCWMKENLKTMHYANGVSMVDGTGIPTLDIVTKYWFNYNDDPDIGREYGKLYSWAALMNDHPASNQVPSGVQGVCPDGWHVPGKAEFEILIDYLGGTETAGGTLKESGNNHWNAPNTGADNQSGFTAFGGGMQNMGSYCNVNDSGHFWTATESDQVDAWQATIYHHLSEIGLEGWRIVKQYGESVRCVKD